MFSEHTSSEGPVYLTSSVLPAVHAFSTRLGGISRNGIPSGAGGRGVATGALIVGIIGIVFNSMLFVFSLCIAGVSYAAYQSSVSTILQYLFFM